MKYQLKPAHLQLEKVTINECIILTLELFPFSVLNKEYSVLPAKESIQISLPQFFIFGVCIVSGDVSAIQIGMLVRPAVVLIVGVLEWILWTCFPSEHLRAE